LLLAGVVVRAAGAVRVECCKAQLALSQALRIASLSVAVVLLETKAQVMLLLGKIRHSLVLEHH
jgi:hypothetical protein